MAGPGGIDFEALERRTLGDTAFARDLLGLFRTHAPTLFERLSHAGSRRTDAAVAAAHRLKGSAGTIAAAELASLLGQIEAHWAAGDDSAAAACLTATKAELDFCLAQIAQRLAHELPPEHG